MPTLPPIYRWRNVAAPRGLVHIVHGMAEHGVRYAPLAAALNEAGFVAWAHDHRGHGQNQTPPVGLGHFADRDGWRLVVDDTCAVSRALQAAHPGVPLLLFAHSMGSFVAQTAMTRTDVHYAGVVLCGSNGSPGLPERGLLAWARAACWARGGRTSGRSLDALVFGTYNLAFRPTRTPADWLSRDVAAVDAYLADPLCGFPLTLQTWVDFLSAKAMLGTAAHLAAIPSSLPIYVIGGSRDPVGEDARGLTRLVDAYRQQGLTAVTLRVYTDARHELVNEINRAEVIRDLIAWLTDVSLGRAAPRP